MIEGDLIPLLLLYAEHTSRYLFYPYKTSQSELIVYNIDEEIETLSHKKSK